jgi:hypothetical protein
MVRILILAAFSLCLFSATAFGENREGDCVLRLATGSSESVAVISEVQLRE